MAEFVAAKSGETEQQWRQFLSFLFAQSSVGKAATGVLVGLGVSQTTTASGSVVVGAGAGPVQAATNDGVSPAVTTSDKTMDILTANPVGATPRNDLIVWDTVAGQSAAIIGSPSSTPTDPTVPSSALLLARVRQIASGQPNYGTIPSSVIDDLRSYTSLFNVSRSAAGSATLPSAAASTAVSVSVTFPTGRFTTAPKVTVQNPANFSNSPLQLWVTGVTTTGCTINGWRSATWGPAAVDWIAVQA